MKSLTAISGFLLLLFCSANGNDSLPESVDSFLVNYCLDCHDADTQKGEIDLDLLEIDWSRPESIKLWNKVHEVLEATEMPPAKKTQPKPAERKAILAWLDEKLTEHDALGGTVLRRLNKMEYQNSVSKAIGAPFSVDAGFPDDPDFHGFNNIGEGLVLSPPLMQQYFELAGKAADTILPPTRETLKVGPSTTTLTPKDFSTSFEASQIRDGVMRLVSQSPIVIRSCTWPTRFEAQYTGTYQFTAQLSAFKPVDKKSELQVELLVVPPTVSFTQIAGLTRAAKLKIPADGEIHQVSAEFDLEKGQTVAFYWANAPIGQDKKADIKQSFIDRPELYAAWKKIGYDRQRSPKKTWQLLKTTMASQTRKNQGKIVTDPKIRAASDNQLNWALENMRMEWGPALNIHGATFHGPTELKLSKEGKYQLARTARFLGKRKGRSDREYADAILHAFLERAFRRPVDESQLADYSEIAMQHIEAGHTFEEGIHLAVRAGLCSTHFLYRGHRNGQLDAYDLASRLSYFLTSAPPDSKTLKLAATNQLSDPEVLAKETRRLLGSKKSQHFLNAFLGQWLDLDVLPTIMPDERLIKRWVPQDMQAITQETQLFVAEILHQNLPMETFIDPDFTYLNKRNAKLYQIKNNNLDKDTMTRVNLPRGHRHGGILGQASVMMATANGVDTQPVLRGVWLLENILGDPPSEPPTNIPAIEPDTTGAKSIRELLTRHMEDASCAGCHSKIDPPGFALENFDPVGRWRDFYPVHKKDQSGAVVTTKGLRVDSASEMVDGTSLKDVSDLKQYLVENIDIFSECLGNKLLTYGTGRTPTFGDRKELSKIVQQVREGGNGFQDLLVAIVLSEAFRTK